MDIIRGSLDGITRSASSHQRQRPDSSVSLHSGTASPALRLDVSNSFEILPPEQDFQYEDHDLAIEEYISDDTDGDADGYSSMHDDAVQQLERLIFTGRISSQSNSASERAEIPSVNNNDKVTAGKTQQKQEETEESENLNDIQDPELRKALKKMRKLDKILMQKISREKEVKRQRRMMHRQYQDELERIKLGMERKEPKEEMENTERFLALVPPPNHSEGIDDEDDENFAASPLFRTEPPEGGGVLKDQQRSGHLSPASDASWQTKDSVKETKQGRGERRRRSKIDDKSAANDEDFIQRNIQLASDAGNTIAMTDDEKNRLGELLKDVEMLGEDQEERKEVTGFELQMLPGTGYKPDKTEEEALKSLDEKLKVLMLPKNFEEICSTPLLENQPKFSNITYQQEAFELGEKILQDHKVSRDYKDRLKQIEEELVALQTQVEKEISSPSLSQDELNDLFRQCDDVDTRTQSALSSPRTPRPTSNTYCGGESWNTQPSTSRESTVPSGANTSRTEKLSEDTLQQLLEEAKAGLGLEEPEIEEEELNIGEGEWADGEIIQQGGDITEVRIQQNSRISQMSSGAAKVPLVSYDIIQKLLRNPRATFDEAQQPVVNNTNEDSMDEEERNQYNR